MTYKESDEYLAMLRDIIREGKDVSLTVSGSSMSPFIIHHRDSIYVGKPDRPLRRGDVVFYQRQDGTFVLHRIRRVSKEGYYIIGDAQTETEGPVSRDAIFGILKSVNRKGKTIKPGDFWWEFFSHVWLSIIPLRRPIIKMMKIIRGE